MEGEFKINRYFADDQGRFLPVVKIDFAKFMIFVKLLLARNWVKFGG